MKTTGYLFPHSRQLAYWFWKEGLASQFNFFLLSTDPTNVTLDKFSQVPQNLDIFIPEQHGVKTDQVIKMSSCNVGKSVSRFSGAREKLAGCEEDTNR